MPIDMGGTAPAPTQLWSLREDVLVEDGPEQGRLVVLTKWGEFGIDGAGDVVRASLRRMCLGPISLENVVGRRPTPGDQPTGNWREWAELWRVLDLLSGSVVRSLGIGDGERPLLSAIPVARAAGLVLPEIEPDHPVRLSRFAAIRPHEGALLVESPLAQYHVMLHRPLAVHVATALSSPTSVREITAQLAAPPAVVAGVVAYLAATGIALLAEPADVAGEKMFAEDNDPVLLRWSHHDLLFHTRSRMGRHGGQSGAVFPLADRLPSPELVKTVHSGERFTLYRPNIDELAANDPPLTEVLENTKLCEDLSDREVTAAQLGELLFRAARIRSVASGSTGTDVLYDISDRPYLSIYGLYELEVYVSAHKCAGVPRGTYHYDPRLHELTLVNDSGPELDELLDGARIAARTSSQPPVLLSLTARVARTSWMYGGIGYALALAHVGALQQTLCLVANAMGLAACAPAVDPGDITNNALRLDWPAEVGVGEFLVG
ncbi:MAG TPA: SagB family peptide dehydrogenase [Pseudonocardiaceae bacterium]|nr:SagB family peptide dehydrogenase [Pseudonocardiaceae bacterium]